MRLIDADALKYQQISSSVRFVYQYEIEQQPTIDAVTVVHLRDMLSSLERKCCGGDEGETYTTGYRNGHHNGQVELLRHILQVPYGTSEDNEKDGDGNG